MGSREHDMVFDLACAIYRGDLAQAEEHLTEMRRAGVKAETIMRARRTVHPFPQSEAPTALVIPIEGHRPGQCGLPSIHSAKVE